MERTYATNTAERAWTHSAAAALVFLVPFLVYSGTLLNGFVYDDVQQVLENPWIRDPAHLLDAFRSSSMAFMEGSPAANTYRPMLHLVFTLEHMVFGLRPWGFHLVNLILHSANAVMVYLLALRMAGGGFKGKMPEAAGPREGAFPLAPVFAALVFGLHPANSEVVSWVSAVPELTFTLFFLVSFCLYTGSEGPGSRARRARDLPEYVLSLAAFLLALFSKETAMALLLVIPAYELSMRGLAGPGALRRAVLRYLPYLLVAGGYMALRTNAVGGLIHHSQVDLDAYGVAVNALGLFAKYLKKLALPVNLSALYAFFPIKSLLEPRALAGVFVVAGLAALFVLTRRRGRVFTSLALVTAPLLPVLYLPGLSASPFAERYLYLPTVGFGLILAAAAGSALGRGGRLRKAAILLASALLVIYAAGSATRGFVWKDNYTLWSDTVEKAPYSTNAHYNLAWSAQQRGELEKAITHYRVAIRLDPKTGADAHYNIALILYNSGRPEEALGELSASLAVDPGYAKARRLLAHIMAARRGGGAEGAR